MKGVFSGKGVDGICIAQIWIRTRNPILIAKQVKPQKVLGYLLLMPIIYHSQKRVSNQMQIKPWDKGKGLSQSSSGIFKNWLSPFIFWAVTKLGNLDNHQISNVLK